MVIPWYYAVAGFFFGLWIGGAGGVWLTCIFMSGRQRPEPPDRRKQVTER